MIGVAVGSGVDVGTDSAVEVGSGFVVGTSAGLIVGVTVGPTVGVGVTLIVGGLVGVALGGTVGVGPAQAKPVPVAKADIRSRARIVLFKVYLGSTYGELSSLRGASVRLDTGGCGLL